MRLYQKYGQSKYIPVGIQVPITPTPMCSYYCISKESVTEAWLVYYFSCRWGTETNQ